MERTDPPHERDRPDHAMPLPASSRSVQTLSKRGYGTTAPHRLGEREILEQRLLRKTAEVLEDVAADEQALVPRENAGPAGAQVDRRLDHSEDHPWGGEGNVEAPTDR